MGFGGAKQQVPSPWGEKQFKHPIGWETSKLDAIREAHSWTYWGPRELYCAGLPLGTGTETFATRAPR